MNGINLQFGSNEIKNVKGILFDLDGTLIDSLDLHIEAFQWVLESMGKDISRKTLEPLMGRTPQDIISEFFDDMDREKIFRAAEEKEEYLEELIKEVYVYPGVIQLLHDLEKHSIRKVVISSTHHKLVRKLLERAGLLERIDDIVSGDEVEHGKPSPDPFLLGLKKSGVEKHHLVGIGDSLHDYRSCSSAGIKFIGVLTGKVKEEQFRKLGASMLINSIKELNVYV